jgi:hypothetical protein
MSLASQEHMKVNTYQTESHSTSTEQHKNHS